ncbi:uncharacterized protein LOC121370737 [Gigantopelta aegis]|uniref:uncharacterized protein LOC121370737 n=1 Tax=Gigantopelta aegis TaxID=1735272 RepID=UPI001B888E79|nr:uncharacterized protein LOC121370737 [Gigantopelta aegis]
MKLVIVFAVLSIVVFHGCHSLRIIPTPRFRYPVLPKWRRWPIWQRRIFIYGIIAPDRKGRDIKNDVDVDGDGFVDVSEIEKMLNERDIGDFMDSMDENGDDRVSVDEFMQRATDA